MIQLHFPRIFTIHIFRLIFFALFAFALFASLSSVAETIGAKAGVGNFGIPTYGNEFNPIYQPGTRTKTFSAADVNGGGTATAAYGSLSVQANMSVPPPSPNRNCLVTPYAFFADTVTINAAGLEGQDGLCTVSYTVDAGYNAGLHFQTRVILHVYCDRDEGPGDGIIPSLGLISPGYKIYYDGNHQHTYSDFGFYFLGQEISQNISFKFGEPFDFWVLLGGQCEAYNFDNNRNSATFAASLVNWSGIKNIRLAGGQPVANPTVATTSGTNFVVSVTTPLPATTNQTQISQLTISSNSIVLQGTNGLPNGPLRVLATPDLSMPAEQWPVISSNRYDGNGSFTITNSVGANAQQFFRVR